MFCDELNLKIIAGDGGNGALSFRREKFIPRGGPDGGDGGRGGNIIFRANPNVNTLSHLSNRKMYKAESGGKGKGNNMTGNDAEDLILDVPQGTSIYTADKSQLIADLNKPNDMVILAQGGKGGMGNLRFTSSTNQAPHFAETGEPGEEKDILLELKLVADVGLIGLPSVGKSTLISVVSNAKPKIAAYHFTTLVPNLGVVNMNQFGGSNMESFVVADIPGLIEGASEGKGLGHKFLRHVSRTKLLVHIIDCTSENPQNDYKTIIAELKLFDKKLSKLKQIVAINKIDMLDEETLNLKIEEIKKLTKSTKIFPISCMTRVGLKELMFQVFSDLTILKKKEKKVRIAAKKKEVNIPVLQPHIDKVKFFIKDVEKTAENTIFHVGGKRIEQLVVMTDIKNPEGLERIYHYMSRMGLQKAVEKKGATFGDVIIIKGKIIPYRR